MVCGGDRFGGNGQDLIEAFRAQEGFSLGSIPAPADIDARWCLRFLRAIRDAAFATVDEDGLPSVRIIDVMGTDGERLYFFTPRGKAFHEDVLREGVVAIVGQTPDYRTCRLRGRAQRLPDDLQHAYVDALFELNPGMEILYPDDKRYICDVFCIEDGEGEYFDLGQKPVFRKAFELGTGLTGKKGVFVIDGSCIGCGACKRDCPEGCIGEGVPYAIDQEHCMRCGICQEVCPAGAVQRH